MARTTNCILSSKARNSSICYITSTRERVHINMRGHYVRYLVKLSQMNGLVMARQTIAVYCQLLVDNSHNQCLAFTKPESEIGSANCQFWGLNVCRARPHFVHAITIYGGLVGYILINIKYFYNNAKVHSSWHSVLLLMIPHGCVRVEKEFFRYWGFHIFPLCYFLLHNLFIS